MLVDTSVWVKHFRHGEPRLSALLNEGHPLCHPFIIGELACGNLNRRAEILRRLSDLPQLPVAEHYDVMNLIEAHSLMGVGIGWIDAHLLAAAILAATPLWTMDKCLAACARRLGVCGEP